MNFAVSAVVCGQSGQMSHYLVKHAANEHCPTLSVTGPLTTSVTDPLTTSVTET